MIDNKLALDIEFNLPWSHIMNPEVGDNYDDT